ncbi:MAG: helix-turn-helix domain-containing protein [Nocardioides sp.]
MITLEDWALIRRLAAEGVPKARIAERLGISRTTVIKAVDLGCAAEVRA